MLHSNKILQNNLQTLQAFRNRIIHEFLSGDAKLFELILDSEESEAVMNICREKYFLNCLCYYFIEHKGNIVDFTDAEKEILNASFDEIFTNQLSILGGENRYGKDPLLSEELLAIESECIDKLLVINRKSSSKMKEFEIHNRITQKKFYKLLKEY